MTKPASFSIRVTSRTYRADLSANASVLVVRDDCTIATGRGRTLSDAVRDGVRNARMAMRLERDERARLGLSLNAAKAELASKVETAFPWAPTYER